LPGLVSKVRTKVLHIRGRLVHLKSVQQSGSEKELSTITSLFEKLRVIEEAMATVEETVPFAGESERE
jgi:hypothetical protein